MAMNTTVLVDTIRFPECPRWHEGKLWFSDFFARRVMSVDLGGNVQMVAELQDMPGGLGWTPEGRLLVVSAFARRLLRLEDGGLVEVADLSALVNAPNNDLVVDGQGRAYIGNMGYVFGQGTPRPGPILLVTPEGSARVVAEGLAFPNGLVITPDGQTLIVAESHAARLTAFDIEPDGSLSHRRAWAQFEDFGNYGATPGQITPDGICLDAEGAVWIASPNTREVLRVKEGAEITDRLALSAIPVACMLGGEDGRTLFVATSESQDPTDRQARGRLAFLVTYRKNNTTQRRRKHRMALHFGVLLPQGWTMELAGIRDLVEAYEMMTKVAQTAEEAGFASAWLVDHFHTIPQPSQEMTFECWTSTAALARETGSIRIGQMVTCNSYRHPALLAKMASTVDVLSHGRLSVGIGAGWDAQEYRAYGYAYPDGPERLRQLREAVQILLAMWTEREAYFEGDYYQVHGAINQPRGVQQPHIPLLIGGDGEQVTLKLVAQYADACNVGDDPATVKQKLAVLKAHCAAVGREYESIHRTSSTLCLLADRDEQALALLPAERRAKLGNKVTTALIGSPETIRQRLAAYEEAGVQELVLRFVDGTNLEALRRFAREFIA